MFLSSRQYREDEKKINVCKFICDILLVAVIAYAMILFTCSRITVSGNSMNPAIESGQTVLVNKYAYTLARPGRYSIVVFQNNDSIQYIKRVVGLPGETIQIKDGYLYINDIKADDDICQDKIITAGIASEPVKLSEDEYFVLGDNRNNSEDSRFSTIGVVQREQIVGKPWLVVSPLDNMRFIK